LRGFSLLELLVVFVVIVLLSGAAALPLAAQVQLRRTDEARRMLDEARDALLGFAAAQGRLPCPATPASFGQEAFAPGSDANDGGCADFNAGLLPAAALALNHLDGQGFLRDPWMTERSRVRYAVFGGAINGVTHTLTRSSGLQMATMQALGEASHYLFVCSTGVAANASGCGPAANQLTKRAAFLVLSTGPNGSLDPLPGSDEARNLDGDSVFVAREAGPDFDDLVDWGGIMMVVNRLVVAGRLP
jgi:prepilin-type N-terminal cleavage/methylation domain-containing protein